MPPDEPSASPADAETPVGPPLPARWCCGHGFAFQNAVLAVFDQRGELDCAVVRYLDVRRGAAYSHGRHRGVDLHVAGLGDIAGDESERPLGQTEQGRIRLRGWVVDEFVQFHAGVARKVERAA